MKMKRTRSLLAVAASLVLMLSAFFFMDAEKANAAGNAVKLEASSVKGYAGKTVTVTVSLAENPGIAGGSFQLHYDKSVLKIKDPQTDVTTSNDAIPASAGPTCRKDGDGFVGYSFAGTDNFTGTGTIFTIKFEILDTAAVGDTALTFTNQETSNDDLKAVDVQVTNGKVTVECEHAQTQSTVTSEATCTQSGVKTLTCTSCGQAVGTEQIPALDHNWGAYTKTKDATCTEKGVETAKCTRCTETQTREIPALGHEFGEYAVTKAATCTEKGVETAKCTRCTETQTREIPALGHDLGEYTITKDATCTEKGVETAKCKRCDESETREIPALGHELGEYTVTKAATCTEKGMETAKCSRCDESVSREIPALGHKFSEYTVTKEATETEEGELTATCIVDGVNVTKVIPVIKQEDFRILNDQGEAATEYTEHTDAVFTAVGQGMDNVTPVAGDIRYIPSGWTLGSASGSWTSAPYSATVALGDKGSYTLNVIYKRQIFDGSEWKADDKIYTSTVSILVKEQEEDNNGDNGEPATEQAQETEKQNVTVISPKTGDPASVASLLTVIAFCGVSGMGIFGFARKRRGE